MSDRYRQRAARYSVTSVPVESDSSATTSVVATVARPGYLPVPLALSALPLIALVQWTVLAAHAARAGLRQMGAPGAEV